MGPAGLVRDMVGVWQCDAISGCKCVAVLPPKVVLVLCNDDNSTNNFRSRTRHSLRHMQKVIHPTSSRLNRGAAEGAGMAGLAVNFPKVYHADIKLKRVHAHQPSVRELHRPECILRQTKLSDETTVGMGRALSLIHI